jgi:hypothetical protein
MQQQIVGNVFTAAWRLLVRNPSIVVPGVVASLVVMPFDLLAPHEAGQSLGPMLALAVVVAVLALFAAAFTCTAGLARSAWSRGSVTLDDGIAAVFERGGNAFFGFVVLGLGWLIALVLGRITVGIVALIYALLTFYVPASLVAGRRSVFAALGDSARIARDRLAHTAMLCIALIILAVATALVAGVLAPVPVLGKFVPAVAVDAVIAYGMLVSFGDYLIVRRGELQPDEPAEPETS